MIRTTIDAFSGLSNPTWVLREDLARATLAQIVQSFEIVSDVDSGYQGLGFRGVVVEFESDSDADKFGLPTAFRIAGEGSRAQSKGLEIAERLIRELGSTVPHLGLNGDIKPGPELRDQLLALLSSTTGATEATVIDSPISEAGEGVRERIPPPSKVAAACQIELGKFNPGFWNNDPNVRVRNNCYNYASNKRTDTFAQPGRGSGHQYTALQCANVSQAAMFDGLHARYNCFPDSEKPRWLVALVMAPNFDYHWYRKQAEGFWGHKPGQTPAKNTDNSGAVITNPETCARAPYTQFCGYYYVPKTQKIR